MDRNGRTSEARECVIIPPRPSRFVHRLGGTSTQRPPTRAKWHHRSRKKANALNCDLFPFRRNRGRRRRCRRLRRFVLLALVDSRSRLPRRKTRDRSMIYPGAIYLSQTGGGEISAARDDRSLTFSVSADLRAPATSRNRTGATATTTGHL